VTFTDGSGAPILVGPRLAGGGQGEVFGILYPPEQVFKKYFPHELEKDPTLEHRLRAMVANKPQGWREHGGHITMAWPTELIFEDGLFVGFTMPIVDMADTVGIHRITNPSDRRRPDPSGAVSWMPSFTWRYLVRAGMNLAQVTESLHMAGTVIGDFNDANVRVGKDARVTLLDCDSMQITDPVSLERFFCRVGRPEFTPPELVNADWKKTVRDPSSDLFALAIHLYALLLEGEHPFRGVWAQSGDKPPVPELARQGQWAHRAQGPLTPRPSAIGFSLLPAQVRELFRAAFEDSVTDPGRRPDGREWYQTLAELEADLRTCATDPEHFYPSFHGDSCPWCQHARRPSRSGPAQPAPPPLRRAPLPPAPVPAARVVPTVRPLPGTMRAGRPLTARTPTYAIQGTPAGRQVGSDDEEYADEEYSVQADE
jgi:DNA-binding helix-hairpin-helix protein with protein kinase domain